MRPAAGRRLRAALLPGALCGLAAAAVALGRGGAAEQAELDLHDLRAASAAARSPASPAVVLVTVDDVTARLAGGTWPIPRGALASVIEEARRAGARVVALALVLEDPQEAVPGVESAALERAIAGGGVVLGAGLSPADDPAPPASVRPLAPGEPAAGDASVQAVRRRMSLDAGGASLPGRFALGSPAPRLALAAAALGGISQAPDPDGRTRALRHVHHTADGDFLSLPLAAAWLAQGRPPVRAEPGRLRLGDRAFPLEPDGRLLVRWHGPWDGSPEAISTYRQVSAALLLRAALARTGEGAVPTPGSLAPLAGSVAVISLTASGSKDLHPTPVNPHATGGEVVAAGVDALLRGEGVRRVPPAADAALALLVAIGAALLSAFLSGLARRPAPGLALPAAGAAALLLAWWLGTGLALGHGLWLPAALPLAAGAVAAVVTQARLRARERAERR